MSNQFPDPSQSPWTNPDTGVEFEYNAETDSWAPSKESTPGVGETLDSVSQRDPQTGINVTVGGVIGMDDSNDAFNGGPHELEARVGEEDQFFDYTVPTLRYRCDTFGDSTHAFFNPNTNLWLLTGRKYNNSDATAEIGPSIGNTTKVFIPDPKGYGYAKVQEAIAVGDVFYGTSEGSGVSAGGVKFVDENTWTMIENRVTPRITRDTVCNEAQNRFYGLEWENYPDNAKVIWYEVGDFLTPPQSIPTNPSHEASRILRPKNSSDSTLVVQCKSDEVAIIYTDDDGQNWNEVPRQHGENRLEISGYMAVVNEKYFVLSKGPNDEELIAISEDLVNWSFHEAEVPAIPEWVKEAYRPVRFGLPEGYNSGYYYRYVECDWDRGFTAVMYSKNGYSDWSGVKIDTPIDEVTSTIFGNDTFVAAVQFYSTLYYAPNFSGQTIFPDAAGLFFDDKLVATRENLEPVIDVINNHTEQISDIDGKYMPLDINTLPSV